MWVDTVGTGWRGAGFAAFVVAVTALDLFAVQRNAAARVSLRQALGWSLVWIALALAFNALLRWHLDTVHGRAIANDRAAEFSPGISSRNRWRWTTSSSS